MQQTSGFAVRVHLLGLLLAALFFAVSAPTLPWSEFASGSENLNVATALEIRRTGNWLLPTLQGHPRIAKPPLTAWITAASIRQSTFDGISSPDPNLRASAYRALGWDVRWPIVLMACLTIFIVYQLALLLGGFQLALFAAIICGTNYAFIRFSRISATDVPLAMFVALANLFLAKAILQAHYWRGCLGAGLALGLAFMSKGPVAFLQTLAPALAFAGWATLARRLNNLTPLPGQPRRWICPALLGLLIMLAIAAPWFVYVINHYDVMSRWYTEVVTGYDEDAGGKWYSYISLFPMMLPWLVLFIPGLLIGLGLTADAFLRRLPPHGILHLAPQSSQRSIDVRRFVLATFLTIIPILLMSFFSERKERYLFPMIGPASILAAQGAIACLWHNKVIPAPARMLAGSAHWAILVAAGVVFPLIGMTSWFEDLRQANGQPWFSPALGLSVAGLCLLILLAGMYLTSRRPAALMGSSLLVMLIVHVMAIHGYRLMDLSESRPLANQIWQQYPTASLYGYRPEQPGRHTPSDLAIYLNRTVYTITDPQAIDHSDKPQVLLVYQRARLPQPTVPAGWTEFARLDRRKDRWYAYGRQPSQTN